MAFPDRRSFLKNTSLLLGAFGLFSQTSWAAENNKTTTSFTRKTIDLWPDNSPNNHVHEKYGRPRLELFIPEGKVNQTRAAIVVCPGGGYYHLAQHEGQPFAEFFASHGIVAAVLTYHVSPHRHPLPYADATRAIRLMRKEAKSLQIDVNKVGIMGFSAGGHLAATVATQPELYKDPNDDLAHKISARPDRLMLGYPVISFQKEYGHLGSAGGLLGKDPDPALVNKLSNELEVSPQNPPAFLFHTADDPVVLLENSLRFVTAYHKYKIPVALHVYPKGSHGVGLALDNPELKSWSGLLMDWLGDWKIM